MGKLFERIAEYVQIKTEQVKLRIIASVAKILANILSLALLSITGFFFLFFLSFSLASLINYYLDSLYAGHLIIAGFYLLLVVLILLLLKKRKIQGWLENLILTISEEDEQED